MRLLHKHYKWNCEHGVLTSACDQCKHQVRVSNVLSNDGWSALIQTKERQYASADELSMEVDK